MKTNSPTQAPNADEPERDVQLPCDAWTQLKPQFEFLTPKFPAAAVAAAAEQREELAPHLAAVVAAVAADPKTASGDSYMLHLFAMHLLAAWRDPRAYRDLARWGHLPPDTLEALLGDVLTESYGRCLASVCDGDEAPIKALAEDAQASDWARSAALHALAVRVLEGDADRDGLIAYLARLGAHEAVRARTQGPAHTFDLLDAIVATACDIGAVELLPTIRDWFAKDLLDAQVAGRSWVERDIARPFAEHQAEELGRGKGYVTDVAREMGWFAAYSKYERDDDPFETNAYETATYVRAAPKVGRNDPCPCGSGKKYKKCCGN